MKLKVMLMIILVIGVSCLWGCGSVKEEVPVIDDEGNLVYETDAPEETIEDSETGDNGDTRHYVGETVTIKANYGGEINVTLTDWGKVRDYLGNPVIYVKYMIENVGSETVTVGNLLFDLYADDYSVQGATVLSEDGVGDEVLGKDLSAGRKLEGVLYRDINPENATVIEVECGNAVFVLKDESTAQNNMEILDEETYVDYDYTALEFAGFYEGWGGYSISFSAYSSVEGIEIGVAEIYYDGDFVGEQYVYICDDRGDWSEWDYDLFYVMHMDGYDEYLGFYKEDEVYMLDYNGPTKNYDILEITEHYES